MRKYLNNLREFAVANPETRKAFLGFSFFTALFLMSPFINVMLRFKPKVTDFSSRVISDAAVNNLDISGRISNYYSIFSGLLIVSALVFLGLYHFAGRTTAQHHLPKIGLRRLYQASLIGTACVFASFLLVNIDFATFFVYFYCLFLLLQIRTRKAYLHEDLAMWAVLVAFSFSNFIYTFFANKDFYGKLDHAVRIKQILLPIDLKQVFLVAIYFVVAVFAWILGQMILKKPAPENATTYRNALFLSALPILFITIFESVSLEIFNILNVRFGYVFHGQMKLYALLTLAATILSVVLFLKFRKRQKHTESNDIITKYYYPLMLLNFGLVCAQPWRLYSPESEFFEFANHGISVDHFFRYGSIPIIETFDAHMMSHELFAYLFGFLNGYEPWAVFLYDSSFSILATLAIYFVFKKAMHPTVAFLIVVSLPLMTLLDNNFTLAAVLGLALIKLLDARTTRNHYLFWIAAILLSLYKLDIGYASIMAALVTYFAVNYIVNQSVEFKKVAVTAAVSLGAMLLLFVILCLVKGVSPLTRLYEFLLVSMSNQNWAIEKMGDANLTVFRIAYYLLPLAVFVMVVWVALKLMVQSTFLDKIRSSKKMQHTLILFLFFAGFFFFNIPRGIVRHTLEFGNIKQITSTIPFAVLLFVLLLKKHRLMSFLGSFIGMYLLMSLTTTSLLKHESSKLAETFGSLSFKEQFRPATDFKGTRVDGSLDVSEIKAFKEILDKLLAPNETYFDFSSKNYYHALTQRKNPLYVNQTPLMINGDKSQEMALGQIKKANPPIVLMPIRANAWSDIDGVYVDYKYYLISEYVYKNYSPVMRTASFDVYALHSKKDAYLKKLVQQTKSSSIEITDFSLLQKPSTIIKNATLAKGADNKFMITPTGANAFFSGLLDGLKNEDKISKTSVNPVPVSFTLNVTPGSVGSIKVYYLFNSADSYSEANKYEFPIQQLNAQDLTMRFLKMPHEFMIAINTSSVKVNSLKIDFDSAASMASSIPSLPEFGDYWIGEVPRLWAEQSDEEAFEKVSNLSSPLIESVAMFQRKQIKDYRKPTYLFIEATSEIEMSAAVTFFDGNEKRNIIHFNIKPGKGSYAIRLSSNYYWWHTTPDSKIALTADKAMKITKLSIISQDGKDEIQYKNGDLSLSNITDENWYGGVGLTNNLLLMDYVPGREKLFKPGSMMQLKDGRAMTIQSAAVVGNYLHIHIVGNPVDYKDAVAFPNTFQMAQ